MILIIVFISFIIIIVIYITCRIVLITNLETRLFFHINLYSCNRPEYLNKTIESILNHLDKYEKSCLFNIIWYDQGTTTRSLFIKQYSIKNSFFLNPMGYPYSFHLSFSYSPTDFVFILEDDWVIDKQNFNKLRYKDFITLSIKLIENVDYVSGIVLRDFPLSSIKIITTTVDTKEMDMIIIDQPSCNMSFTNGPSIYKASVLSQIQEYISELLAGQWFYYQGYRLALFNNSGCRFTQYVIDTHVFYHIGYSSSRFGLCNNYLY